MDKSNKPATSNSSVFKRETIVGVAQRMDEAVVRSGDGTPVQAAAGVKLSALET